LSDSTSPITCSRCGAPIAAGARYCASCGLDISTPQGGVTTIRVDSPIASVRRDAMLQALREATLGEYDLLGELGRGGMATVYLAHDIALDRKVAIKVMSPTLFSGEGMAERFKREARTAGQLSHPHIIPIYAVKEHGDLLFFVMKYVEGRPLDSIIREVGPLPIPMVQTILQQVGSALGYAHRRGVIHRDIKPANVMLDADGWAIVTDFGIAKVSESQGLTVTGATVGTPSYMSPEQCAAKELTGASDQYSLGVVAYEMLVGKLPFVAESVMAVMYAHFNEPPPPVSQARPDCPPSLANAVMRMLEKDPDQRFPNMEAATAAAGAMPLAADDPVRTQMMTLAAAGPNQKLIERFSTPISDPSAMRSGPGSGTRPSIGTLTISPGRISIAVGELVQLRAAAKSRRGQAIGARPVSWASTSTDIARISPTGLLTAVAPGTVTITASSDNTSATATVEVVASRRSRRRGLFVGGGVAVVGVAVLFWMLVLRGSSVGAPPATDSLPGRLADQMGHDSQPVSMVPLGAVPPGSTKTVTRDTAPSRPTPRRTPAIPAPPPAHDSSASTVATALASAQTARDQALDAGAAGADLVAGDSELQLGLDSREQGHQSVAFEHLRTAARLFARAESTAAAARIAAQRRAPPVDTAPKPAPVQPPPVDPGPEIRRAIGDYASALEKRDMGAVLRVFPDIPQGQSDNLRQFFAGASDIHAQWEANRVTPSGDQAEAHVTLTLTFKQADNHAPGRAQSEITLLLARRPSGPGWMITAIR
jgi:serine/threonine protein kinase